MIIQKNNYLSKYLSYGNCKVLIVKFTMIMSTNMMKMKIKIKIKNILKMMKINEIKNINNKLYFKIKKN